jgi:uncharacterized protein YbaR (Trm112 family)
MRKIQHETGHEVMLACPACKQPVGVTIKGRHKTLGVVVPVWGPGPCRNPDCPEHLEKSERTPRHQ